MGRWSTKATLVRLGIRLCGVSVCVCVCVEVFLVTTFVIPGWRQMTRAILTTPGWKRCVVGKGLWPGSRVSRWAHSFPFLTRLPLTSMTILEKLLTRFRSKPAMMLARLVATRCNSNPLSPPIPFHSVVFGVMFRCTYPCWVGALARLCRGSKLVRQPPEDARGGVPLPGSTPECALVHAALSHPCGAVAPLST